MKSRWTLWSWSESQPCLAKNFCGVYNVDTLSPLREFLSDLLVASEEATVPGEEPQGSVRWFFTNYEIRRGFVIGKIFFRRSDT